MTIICRSMLRRRSGRVSPSCFSAAEELLLVLELVLLADVGDDLRELLVGEREAQLLAALQEQQFVDGVAEHLRRHLVEHLAELGVALDILELDVAVLGADGGDLALLEVGLGEDFAVHLHEDLFDDLGAERQGGGRGEGERQGAPQGHAADSSSA